MERRGRGLQRVVDIVVDIPFRNLAETDVLPGDVDIEVAGVEVDIERVIDNGLWADLCWARGFQTGLIIDLPGVSGVIVLAAPVGQVGLHHGQPSPAVKNNDNKQ